MTLVSTAAKASGTGGGMTLLSDTVLGADTASFDITGLAQTYLALRFLLDARSTKAATSGNTLVRFNNDSGANYFYENEYASTATPTAQEGLAQTSMYLAFVAAASAPAGRSSPVVCEIPNYAGTTFHKNLVAYSGTSRAATTGNQFVITSLGTWASTAAISRITILPDSGNFLAGSRLTIWGMS